jgi:uncharacterized protein (DUF1697 family)
MLRGVNVAGNKLAMSDLVRVVESLGGREIETYLQSGNVVYDGPKKRLEQALLDEVGVRSPVIVRAAAQLASVVDGKPFAADGKAVSVTFLAAKPAKVAVAGVDPAVYGDDEFRVVGDEIYLYTPGGYGRSKLHNAFWERKLGTTATTRNWNTVLALAELTAKR